MQGPACASFGADPKIAFILVRSERTAANVPPISHAIYGVFRDLLRSKRHRNEAEVMNRVFRCAFFKRELIS